MRSATSSRFSLSAIAASISRGCQCLPMGASVATRPSVASNARRRYAPRHDLFRRPGVGAETDFGSYEVTREEVLEFARKYDPQPFHLSDEEAAKTHFGRLAASGWHTAAMTMAVIARHVVDESRPGWARRESTSCAGRSRSIPATRSTCAGRSSRRRRRAAGPRWAHSERRRPSPIRMARSVMTFISIVLIRRRPASGRLPSCEWRASSWLRSLTAGVTTCSADRSRPSSLRRDVSPDGGGRAGW